MPLRQDEHGECYHVPDNAACDECGGYPECWCNVDDQEEYPPASEGGCPAGLGVDMIAIIGVLLMIAAVATFIGALVYG